MERFIVAQLGARMDYAVPRILHQVGALEKLFTDLCVLKGLPRPISLWPEFCRPAGIKRLAGRNPAGVPREKITPFNLFGFHYLQRRRNAKSAPERLSVDLWAGRTFGKCVAGCDWRGASAVYAFSSAALEIFQRAKSEGLRTVLEMPGAPREFEAQLMRQEHELWPGWESSFWGNKPFDDFVRRQRQEWALADEILVGSSYVKDCIAEIGGPAGKCVIVPYGVDFPPPVQKQGHEGPLRVLTACSVRLQKGIQYAMQAAKAMGDRAHFRIVGPINISEAGKTELGRYVELKGPVPKIEMPLEYQWADVFLLPSLSEGSATVIYEALAASLPVICTTNSGSIIRNGVDGFIIPIRDVNSIVGILHEMIADRGKITKISFQAQKRAKQYTIKQYNQRLSQALGIYSNEMP